MKSGTRTGTGLSALIVMALGLGTAAIVQSGRSPFRPDAEQQRVQAERLEREARLHVSCGALLTSVEAKLRSAGERPGGINLAPLDALAAEGISADAYRNAAVATQQGLRVVIEKADQWPEAKLKLLLDGAAGKLAETEKLRRRVMLALARDALGESDPGTLREIERGQWSGFEPTPHTEKSGDSEKAADPEKAKDAEKAGDSEKK